jgi:hypothetical protein
VIDKPLTEADDVSALPQTTLDVPDELPELPLRAAAIWLEILLTHATRQGAGDAGALATVELPRDDSPPHPDDHTPGLDRKEPTS